MELKNILSGLEGLKAKGNLNIDISNINSDSRKIKEGGLFIAIKGFDVDGHDYIKPAIEKGAVAVIVGPEVDRKLLKEIADKVTIVLAPDTRLALAICACNFNGNPSKKFKLVGITGTKGKTTTSFMVKRILEKAGKKAGIYASRSWFNNKLNDDKLSDHYRWVAEYASTTAYKKRYEMWQYTSSGSIDGIKGRVDLDISYLDK